MRLIAAEAKYHRDCFSSYVSREKLRYQGLGGGESAHEAAFQDLIRGIGPEILEQGSAYDMSSLLLKYQQCLREKAISGESYLKHRLQDRPRRYFGDDIKFFLASKGKVEIVYSSALFIQDLINKAAEEKSRAHRSPVVRVTCHTSVKRFGTLQAESEKRSRTAMVSLCVPLM